MLEKDKIKAILFDLDGTLMDTDDQAVEALARRLQRLRLGRAHKTARRLVMASETPGNAMMTLVDMLGLDGHLMAFTNRLRRWRGLHTPSDFRIMAGAAEMLADLHGRYRLAVVTTRGRSEAEAFLDQYDLGDLFDVVVTRESTWRLKPHPAPIQHASQSLETSVEQCVMVGDTPVDVKSARRAGAWAAAVLCGFGKLGELEKAGAHVVLEHTANLPSWL